MKTLLTTLLLLSVLSFRTYPQTKDSSTIMMSNDLLSESDMLIDKGVKLNDAEDYKGAIELYKKALDKNPKSDRADYEMANTYMNLKNYSGAIDYADKAINLNGNNAEEAYVIKGTVLDTRGDTKEALKVYEKGIQTFPGSYLLHYNMALTYYKQQNDKEAEDEIARALAINPSYANSHLLLSYIKEGQGERIQTTLALYNFLLLEPTGSRARTALRKLDSLLKKITARNGNNSAGNKQNEFSKAEVMIALVRPSNSLMENKGESKSQLFYDNTNTLFTTLSDLKKNNKGFWWDFYVDFFAQMSHTGNTEAMCYYISQSSADADVSAWLKNNGDKIKTMEKWLADKKRGKVE